MTQDNFLNGAASQQTIGESSLMTRPDLLTIGLWVKFKILFDFIQVLSIET
jgi:hypothetical protein